MSRTKTVKIFSNKLRKYIQLAGYTNSELSREIGRCDSYIRDSLHNQRIPLKRLNEICPLLGIDAENVIIPEDEEESTIQTAEWCTETAIDKTDLLCDALIETLVRFKEEHGSKQEVQA